MGATYHSNNGPRPSDQKSDASCNSQGQSLWIIPRRPVIAPGAPEKDVLLQDDHQEHHDPVTDQRQHALEHFVQRVATPHRTRHINHSRKRGENRPRDLLKEPAQHLEVHPHGVRTRRVISHQREDIDHRAEFAKPAEGIVRGHQQPAGAVAVLDRVNGRAGQDGA